MGGQPPQHRAQRGGVEPLQLQRQRDQLIVAGGDVGEHQVLDNSYIVAVAGHVRRQVFRGFRIDRGHIDADQPDAARRQPFDGFRRQRAKA